jgi:hypothetical protein
MGDPWRSTGSDSYLARNPSSSGVAAPGVQGRASEVGRELGRSSLSRGRDWASQQKEHEGRARGSVDGITLPDQGGPPMSHGGALLPRA